MYSLLPVYLSRKVPHCFVCACALRVQASPGESRVPCGVRDAPESTGKADGTYMWLLVKSSCSMLLLLLLKDSGFFLERHEPNLFFFFFSLGLVGDEASARALGKLSHFSLSSFSWDLDFRKIFLNVEVFGALMIAAGSGGETLVAREKRARCEFVNDDSLLIDPNNNNKKTEEVIRFF